MCVNNPTVINKPCEYLKEDRSYIFIDKVIIKGNTAFAYKKFSCGEWYFKCHFPDKPVAPIVFQIEAMAQLAVVALKKQDEKLKLKDIILNKYTDVFIYKPIFPDDAICIKTEILNNDGKIVTVKGCACLANKERETKKEDFSLIFEKENGQILSQGEFSLEII